MKLLALLPLLVVSPLAAAIPVVDLSSDTFRQVVIAAGTPEVYQGHPTTLLLPDGKTMLATWSLGHGGACGPLKRSTDGGKSWSPLLETPADWRAVSNCPALYRLTDPQGKSRLFVFAGQGPDGAMHQSISLDDGQTWSPMRSNGLKCVMPFCTIVAVENGQKLIGLTNIRRPGETKDPRSNIIAQSESTDGGLTWSPWRILLDLDQFKPCEPEVVRSPDSKQLLCLMRENVRTEPARFMTSDDEGRTWSPHRALPPGLHGDRHKAVYTPDGRLVVAFRDMGRDSPTKNHFVVWVGRYEDILAGRDGQYKIKVLHSHKGSDCGYPGLEILPDGTLVATTYVKYRPGADQNSVVSSRFTLAETDQAANSLPTTKTRASNAPEPNRAPRKALQIQPLRSAAPDQVNGKSFDLAVVGATPGGIAAAVRAAREGSSVLLVQHNQHIGGMLTNGLMQWDAIYGGPRAPLFNAVAQGIESYYRNTYGAESKQYASARYSQQHYPVSRFESSVAEHVLNQLVSSERKLTVLLSHYPHRIVRRGTTLETLTLRDLHTQHEIAITAQTYVDATYEGDLAALAKVPYRVGREGRSEFGEPHAGKLFTNILRESGPQDVKLGLLNLHLYGHRQGTVDPSSSGAADLAVQAYNYRFCLTNEDGNRRLPEKPPGYRREEYVNYYRLSMSAGAINGKSTFNAALLPGENHAYPEADWPTRQQIIDRHKNFALGLMWFLQNDESVSAASRARYRQIGLPLDEFPDNQNIPYEMYVREGRRIVGRYVFTEHDNRLAAGLVRPPIHPDSIAFTDWPMDSHDCTWDRHEGFEFDGKLILTEESRPAHIPYRCLLPQGLDNLLVPVCLSATHVAWGAVRLEPVWMQTGEAAGWAAVLAKRHHTTPAALDSDLLVRTLCQQRHFISFFNDLAQYADHAAMPAAQYAATQGFYQDYNARLTDQLTADERSTWEKALAKRWPQIPNVAAAESAATRGDLLVALWNRLP